MFQALTPRYEKTGETTYGPDDKPIHWFAVSWRPQGIVQDLPEARDRFGRNVVLEWIGKAR